MTKLTDKRNVRIGDSYSYFETRPGSACRKRAKVSEIAERTDHRKITLDNGKILYRAKDKLNY